ncbi:MAG: hypothetical protein ISS29_07110 [Candidatus Marinimicrobia bacterium]|nr:hypothetical protein [Candidatus Neomarinimicrobiota bacterium]
MNKLSLAKHLYSLLLIAILLTSCSQSVSIKIVVPEDSIPASGNSLHLYLLNSDEFQEINAVRTGSADYFRKKSLGNLDSLRRIKRTYDFTVEKYQSTLNNCSTLIKILPAEYCANIDITPVKIQKYGDVWQLWVDVLNKGSDDIWGLVFSVHFKNDLLMEKEQISIFLRPQENLIFKKVYLDLSQNIPLQYSMSTYPGGLNKLLEEAIEISVDSTISTFSHSLSTCKQQSKLLKQDLENIGVQYDTYVDQMYEYLDESVVKPANKMIENNLLNSEKRTTVSAADTVNFDQLEKGIYNLLIYSNVENDSLQWLIPVELLQDLMISIRNYHPASFFLNKEKYIIRVPELTE